MNFVLLTLQWGWEKWKMGYLQLGVMGLRVAVCVLFGACVRFLVVVGP